MYTHVINYFLCVWGTLRWGRGSLPPDGGMYLRRTHSGKITVNRSILPRVHATDYSRL